MNWVGTLGIAMSVVGFVAVAVELLLMLPPVVRLTKRLRQLTLLYEDNLRLTRDELQILEMARAETRELLRPFRRLRRLLLHPVTIALFASYRRRSAILRSSTPA
jgi:hypothetical protein